MRNRKHIRSGSIVSQINQSERRKESKMEATERAEKMNRLDKLCKDANEGQNCAVFGTIDSTSRTCMFCSDSSICAEASVLWTELAKRKKASGGTTELDMFGLKKGKIQSNIVHQFFYDQIRGVVRPMRSGKSARKEGIKALTEIPSNPSGGTVYDYRKLLYDPEACEERGFENPLATHNPFMFKLSEFDPEEIERTEEYCKELEKDGILI